MYCKRIYFYETYFLIFHCRCTNLKENKNKVVELRYKTKSICGPVVQSLNIKTPNFYHYLKKCSIVKHSIYLSLPFIPILIMKSVDLGQSLRLLPPPTAPPASLLFLFHSIYQNCMDSKSITNKKN